MPRARCRSLRMAPLPRAVRRPRHPCVRLGDRRALGRGSLASLRGVRTGEALELGELTPAVELLAQTIDCAVLQRAHRSFTSTRHASHISGPISLDKTQEEYFPVVGLQL